MELQPYLFFYGRCEEALEFYKSAIGGTYDPEAGNVSLSIGVKDAAQGQQIFDALAQGGSVKYPFGDAFWGGKHGVLTDRFGVEWMVTSG